MAPSFRPRLQIRSPLRAPAVTVFRTGGPQACDIVHLRHEISRHAGRRNRRYRRAVRLSHAKGQVRPACRRHCVIHTSHDGGERAHEAPADLCEVALRLSARCGGRAADRLRALYRFGNNLRAVVARHGGAGVFPVVNLASVFLWQRLIGPPCPRHAELLRA